VEEVQVSRLEAEVINRRNGSGERAEVVEEDK
jgi:hypothetical protein